MSSAVPLDLRGVDGIDNHIISYIFAIISGRLLETLLYSEKLTAWSFLIHG